jgi:hypothetical protein
MPTFVPVIRRFTDWLLYTSVFAALCAVALCMATERLILQRMPSSVTVLHGFIFGSSLIVYNVHYLVKKSSGVVSDRVRWTTRNRYWNYEMLGLGTLACLVLVWFMPLRLLLGCGLLGLLSFAYSLPLLPGTNKKRLKDFGRIKIAVLSIVWTVVTAVLPMLYWQRAPLDYPFELLLRFVLMFVLCAAFDVRDMQTDLDADIFTLPNRIGVAGTYKLIDLLIVVFSLLCVAQYIRFPSVLRLSGGLVTAVLMKWSMLYTRTHPSDKAYLAYVDGIMLVYGLLVLLH